MVGSPCSVHHPSSRTCSSFLFSPSSQPLLACDHPSDRVPSLCLSLLPRSVVCSLPASAVVPQLVLQPSSSLMFHQPSAHQPLDVLGQVLSPSSVDPPSSRTCSSFLFSPSSQPLLACDHPSDRVPSLCLSLLPRSVVCSLVPASAGVSQLVLQPSSSLMFHQPSAHQPLDVLGLQVLSPSVDPPSSRTCSSFLFSPSSQLVIILLIGCLLRACLCCLSLLCVLCLLLLWFLSWCCSLLLL